jgi:hypothetical protein
MYSHLDCKNNSCQKRDESLLPDSNPSYSKSMPRIHRSEHRQSPEGPHHQQLFELLERMSRRENSSSRKYRSRSGMQIRYQLALSEVDCASGDLVTMESRAKNIRSKSEVPQQKPRAGESVVKGLAEQQCALLGSLRS